MKKNYEPIDIQIICFEEDVTMASPGSYDGTGTIPDSWDDFFKS